MKVNIEQNGDAVVVSLVGEFDTTATSAMGEVLKKVISLAGEKLVIDCKELEYISSSGLRFFMQLKRSSEEQGGSISLQNMNEDVEDIFRISGFHHIFNIEK